MNGTNAPANNPAARATKGGMKAQQALARTSPATPGAGITAD
jgi:hypothetical protein